MARSGEAEKLAREMAALGAHLSRFPYLGLDHPVGRRILEAVHHAPKVTLKEALWHRARLPDGPEQLTAAQMGPPPANWTEGRFNHHGQTVFYLASSAYGACAETASTRRCIAWAQRFRVRRLHGLLDLAGVAGEEARGRNVELLTAGLNAVMERLKPNRGSPWKPEYFVPRFVADAARAGGFRGILYCSVRFEGYNAVLFEWTKEEIRPEGGPVIVQFCRGRSLPVTDSEAPRSPARSRPRPPSLPESAAAR